MYNETHDSDDVEFEDSIQENQISQQKNQDEELNNQQPTIKTYRNLQIRKILHERDYEFQKRQREANMNNMPTDIGKHFTKFLQKNFLDKNLQVPEKLVTFVKKLKYRYKRQYINGCLKKNSGHYNLNDYNEFISCDQSREYFKFFLTYFAFQSLQASSKVLDPLMYIETIEHYLLCTNSISKISKNRKRKVRGKGKGKVKGKGKGR